eukprot:scaffold3226_cov160-Amphora_coffeaeformis.AAC.3
MGTATRAIFPRRQQQEPQPPRIRGRIQTTRVPSARDFYKHVPKKKRYLKRAKSYYDKIAMTLRKVRDRVRGRIKQGAERSFEEYLEDDLAIIVNNDEDILTVLKAIYDAGHSNPPAPDVLLSLARIRQATETKDSEVPHDSVETVALYLSKGLMFLPRPVLDKERSMSLAFLVNDEVVDLEALALFLSKTTTDLPPGLKRDDPIWWELRAHVSDEIYKICSHASVVASAIAQGALSLESGLQTSTGWVCSSVRRTGRWVQAHTPEVIPARKDRAQVVQLTYTNAARRASLNARENTRKCMDSLLYVSGAGIARAHAGLSTAQKLPPWAEAAGQVGMAGLGAFVIVGEATVTSTRKVVQTTAKVTADVIEHKYGPTAGQSLRDCTETIGNAWLTVQSALTLTSPTAWTRVVAKHGCKQHLREQQNLRRNGTEAPTDTETEALFDHAFKHFIL